GKKLQMISGIHFNMQISPAFIQLVHEEAKKVNGNSQSLKDFQSDFYLRLSRNFLRYQRMLVYLSEAAPIADDSFFRLPSDEIDHPARSIRNTRLGSISKDDVTATYDNLED